MGHLGSGPLASWQHESDVELFPDIHVFRAALGAAAMPPDTLHARPGD
ncbi:MAG: hypothetical protein KGJ86_09480 [Chloroflexota bacterium]|nr:hypothetical protein [Chloroflexota bacterium]